MKITYAELFVKGRVHLYGESFLEEVTLHSDFKKVKDVA